MSAKQFTLASNRAVEVIAFPRVIDFSTETWNDAEGEEWIRRENLDAIVSLSHWPIALLDRVRTRSGERLGYASLSVQPGQPYSGAHQHTEEIGAAAMEMSRELLISGERGTVHRPRVLLLEGEWIEGETTPGPRQDAAHGSRAVAGLRGAVKKTR